MESAPIAEIHSSGESLADHKLATLIGAIGNNEGKALLLTAMASRVNDYRPGSLHRLLTDLPGMETVNAGNINVQSKWCQRSIEPAGLVKNFGAVGTHITPLGLKLGVPLAGLLLDHTDKYDIPLVELFGEARSSSEVSSQYIRLRIVEELLTSPEGIQLGDLVRSSDASNQVVIEKQLRKLSNAGLVTYEDWNEAVSQIRYEVTPNSNSGLSARTGFSGLVAKQLLESLVSTHDQIIENCVQTIPGFSQLERRAQSGKVAGALYSLKQQGLVKKIEGRVRPSKLNVSLTAEQLEQWTELCNKLEGLKSQNSEELAKWTKVASEFITDPDKVCRAFERYRNSSARANPTERNLGTIVLRVLTESGELSSVREVVRLASDVRGTSVSHFGVVTVLNRLVEQGVINKEQGKVLMYGRL